MRFGMSRGKMRRYIDVKLNLIEMKKIYLLIFFGIFVMSCNLDQSIEPKNLAFEKSINAKIDKINYNLDKDKANDNFQNPLSYYKKVNFSQYQKSTFDSLLFERGISAFDSITVEKIRINPEDSFLYLVQIGSSDFCIITDVNDIKASAIFYNFEQNESYISFKYYFDNKTPLGDLNINIKKSTVEYVPPAEIDNRHSNNVKSRNMYLFALCVAGSFIECMQDVYDTDTLHGWLMVIATSYEKHIAGLVGAGCLYGALDLCEILL